MTPDEMIGKIIEIESLPEDPAEELYVGQQGIVTSYDYDCDHELRYWGTWGGIAIYPNHDRFKILEAN